ncbi:MAG: HvfB family MNIO-type RiPP peptide maturase [Gammaproteobacteria bacterium]
MVPESPVNGAGLGLRRAHLGPLLDRIPAAIDFMELAPENWIGAGGRLGDTLAKLSAKVPFVSHGLLGNFGGHDAIDFEFLDKTAEFMRQHNIRLYGDHMTYCADEGQLYELLPVPYTEASAVHMADRIKCIQDHMGRQVTVENASYYLSPLQTISEADFINQVLEKADCWLLLDINNVYVNSSNHQYDAREFLRQLPGERIAYAHIAGHLVTEDQLIIDTHGEDVIDPVWSLLEYAYEWFGVFPTLLERDENIPDLQVVLEEVEKIRSLQHRFSSRAISPGNCAHA